MNNNDMRLMFTESQEGVVVSDDLKQRTLDMVARAAEEKREQPAAPKPRARRALKRAALAGCAACLALALVAGGIASVAPESTPSFAILAYAEGCSEPLSKDDEGLIAFARASGDWISAEGDYAQEGAYTGCLFGIEAEGVTRIQANVSKGMLYRYEYETFRIGDAPDKWEEAISWKPTKRGLGTYYADYDMVHPVISNHDEASNPDTTCQVNLSKMLGSTVDIAIDPAAPASLRLGFWTNEKSAENPDSFGMDAAIDVFEGQTLTVTVTFEDGSTATQEITLHAQDMEVVTNESASPEDASTIALKPVDANEEQAPEDGRTILHTLYGSIDETNGGAFPLPLDNANEYADAPLESTQLGRIPLFEEIEQPYTVAHDGKAALRATADLDDLFCEKPDGVPAELTVSDFSAHTIEALPEGVTLDDTAVIGGLGSLEYFNHVRSQTSGLTVDENGIPNDDYALAVFSYDLTNESDKALRTLVDHFSIGIASSNGTLLGSGTDFPLCTAVAAHGTPSDYGYGSEAASVVVSPGESVRVNDIRIVSKQIIGRDDLVGVFMSPSPSEAAQALPFSLIA